VTTEYVFQVKGMTCPLCVWVVQGAVRRIKGVSGVKADLRSGRVVVTTTQPLTAEKVSKAIRGSGGPFHKFEANLLGSEAG
jgi:mercuric ion binding protein